MTLDFCSLPQFKMIRRSLDRELNVDLRLKFGLLGVDTGVNDIVLGANIIRSEKKKLIGVE